MAKMTLLEMVQDILSAMDSDIVDTTDETEESQQVKNIIINTHDELMSRKEWHHLKLPVRLEALDVGVGPDHPTTLLIPENVMEIDQVRYDVRGEDTDRVKFNTLTYKDPGKFLDLMLCRSSDSDDISTVGVVGSSAEIMVYHDRQPSYWTSFDDQHVTFDAYDSGLGTTLPADRSIVYATLLPEFDADDDEFIPNMPARMFPLFLAECKKAAFFYLKEIGNPIDDKRALRGAAIYNDRGSRAHDRVKRVRYGRCR